MNSNSQTKSQDARKAYWIAAGFIGAFAASVLTVIYTGLMVEGSRSEFDVGFRSVSLTVGETRAIELVFDVQAVADTARLELDVPAMLEAPAPGGLVREVSVVPGENRFTVELRATDVAQGYLIARLIAAEPLALERIFVTVESD